MWKRDGNRETLGPAGRRRRERRGASDHGGSFLVERRYAGSASQSHRTSTLPLPLRLNETVDGALSAAAGRSTASACNAQDARRRCRDNSCRGRSVRVRCCLMPTDGVRRRRRAIALAFTVVLGVACGLANFLRSLWLPVSSRRLRQLRFFGRLGLERRVRPASVRCRQLFDRQRVFRFRRAVFGLFLLGLFFRLLDRFLGEVLASYFRSAYRPASSVCRRRRTGRLRIRSASATVPAFALRAKHDLGGDRRSCRCWHAAPARG